MSEPSVPKKSKTIFRSIALPLLIMLVAQTLLLGASLVLSGVFTRLRDNERSILNKQVENRRDYMQNVMISNWMQLHALSTVINNAAERLLNDGTITIDTLDNSSEACMPLLYMVAENIVSDFRSKRVSGIYVIFNSDDLSAAHESGSAGKKPGIYIRDLDPASSPSVRNEDLLFEFAPSALVRSMNISTDNGWSTMFSYNFDAESASSYDFFYKPFQTAWENEGAGEADDYGYWHISPFSAGSHAYTLTYTVPLILRNGTVYGVIGIDMTLDYLQDALPYAELFDDGNGTYLLGYTWLEKKDWNAPGEITLTPVAASGERLKLNAGETILLDHEEGQKYYSFSYDGNRYYASAAPFQIYSNNAPFENERWFLIGAVERGRIDQFPNQVAWVIMLVVIITFAFGVAAMMIISRRLSGSIRTLSDEIVTAQQEGNDDLALTATGIQEIDVFARTITELSQARMESSKREQLIIAHERDYDFLTGLMNRRAFYRSAEGIMSAERNLLTAALIMLDLDNLKHINDRYGHDTGDRYIYRAASCFRDALPDEALIGRMSGDEFLVLLHGYASHEDILDIVDALSDSIQESVFMLPDHKKDIIRVSGGIAWYPKDGSTFDELMKKADFAMYQAKLDGKGRFAEFDADKFNTQSVFNKSLAELDDLMSHPELMTYHFQPIIRASTGTVYAYEALMRVTNLPLLRSPDEVLMLARTEHRLHDIEWLTWSRTLACYRELVEQRHLPPEPYIFINSIASEHLHDAEVRELTERFGDILAKLVIEITESENMDAEAMEYKRNMPGLSGAFALDDYGSGYNSEKMLLDLAPRYIKVDISIIRNVDTSVDKQMIVSNIVKYAHERNMLVIAEGLETEAEVRTAIDLHVDLLQGYYLAKPARIPDQLSEQTVSWLRELYKETTPPHQLNL